MSAVPPALGSKSVPLLGVYFLLPGNSSLVIVLFVSLLPHLRLLSFSIISGSYLQLGSFLYLLPAYKNLKAQRPLFILLFLFLLIQASNVFAGTILSKIVWVSHESD